MKHLPSPRFSVAPMMKYTDRHCRYFHRLLSRRAVLFTEMVSSSALIYGDVERHLRYDQSEHPVVLQLGGSDPDDLARATSIAAPYGYDEINLNIGCPSDSAQEGCFGAALMKQPDLVMRIVDKMQAVSSATITVKCRIGVDDQEPEDVLPDFLTRLTEHGISRVYIHARKAWLKGLSPKDNRTIPPLNYPLVEEMKRAFPNLEIVLNGGLNSLQEATPWLEKLDGVMLGRAAYHNPDILTEVDSLLFGDDVVFDAVAVLDKYAAYAEAEWNKGTTVAALIKPLLGLYGGRRGARAFRRHLTLGANQRHPPRALILEAQTQVSAYL